MSLTVRKLEFRNFRNYDHLLLDHLGPMTILVGENAVGKTNIVEGIQLMTAMDSFRHPQISHLIKQGHEQGMVEATLVDGSRQVDLGLMLYEGKRSYLFNGKPKKAGSLRSLCPAVMFNPDDLELVKGSHGGRRDALDSLIGQLSANHQVICRDFANVIKNKNALLKDEASDDLLRSINEMVILCGSQLAAYRLSLFPKLADYVAKRYESIVASRETLTFTYEPSWCEGPGEGMSRDEIREKIATALDISFEEEKRRHRSIVGPHCDHLTFQIDGRDASVFASQGQQRSVVLAFKIAEVSLIQDILGQQPVLLLDDVMSELDESRRNMLVRFIEDDMQVFITTTNLSYFQSDLLEKADIIHLPLAF